MTRMVEPSPKTESTQPDRNRSDDRRTAPAYQPLVIVLVAVCGGMVIDRYWPVAVAGWWSVAAGAWIAWLVLWRKGCDRAASLALLAAVAATGGGWHHCRWYLFGQDDLGHFARTDEEPACVEAIARKTPQEMPRPQSDPLRAIPSSDRTRVEVEVTGIRDGRRWRAASGRARLDVNGQLHSVRPGDRLLVFARLSAPRGPQNPAEFDYAGYLRAGRVRSRLRAQFPECVSVAKPGSRWNPWQVIERTRAHGSRVLRRYLDPRRADLAAAILLGVRERLDGEQKRAFMETGTIHLLAISGLHVGILAGALLWVMRRAPIPRGRAMLIVAGLTVFYMLLTDARPPVIRATIMVLVICWSIYLGRRPLSFNTLALAALIVLAANPADLFQTGAQLSFLAVAGLMWFGPRWIYGPPDRDPVDWLIAENRTWPAWLAWVTGRGVRRLALVSGVIWLLTMPLVMARFNLFTPIAVLLNTVLWVPMVAALMTGFATLVFGTLIPPLGAVFGGLCNGVLGLLDWCVTSAAQLPWSHRWVPGPADWWLLVFYGGLGLLTAFPRLRPPRRWCLGLLGCWIAVGFAPALLRQDEGRLRCTFLSVGHGCATVLELPSGKTMLYDAGQLGSPVMGTRSVAAYLWSRGITHIDAVVISHADVDHYNALPGLFEQFSVGAVYVSPVMWHEENPAMTALRQSIRDWNIPLREIHAGDRMGGGDGCLIEVLHPPRRGILGGDNANTIVLDVRYLGRRILLPGDLDEPGLQDVLAEEPTDYDVLLAPHHGSRRSNSPELARWSTPEWVIVSGSHRWDPAAIRAVYKAAGARVLHTAECGAVEVVVDGAGVRVDGLLGDAP